MTILWVLLQLVCTPFCYLTIICTLSLSYGNLCFLTPRSNRCFFLSLCFTLRTKTCRFLTTQKLNNLSLSSSLVYEKQVSPNICACEMCPALSLSKPTPLLPPSMSQCSHLHHAHTYTMLTSIPCSQLHHAHSYTMLTSIPWHTLTVIYIHISDSKAIL